MPALKRFLYYFTAFCFLFTGTVVPALLGMRVFANDIDETETVVYDSGFINSDTSSDQPVIPLSGDTPREITDAVDSVTIVRNVNINEVLFEWKSEGNTTQLLLDKINEASSWRLTAEWSIKDTDAKAGDYFTIEIPLGGIFDPIYLSGGGEIRNTAGELTATYEIIPKSGGKEVKITLTDYVEGRSDIKGDFWCVLFVGYVDGTTFKTIQLVVNDIMIISDDIQVIARPNDLYYPTSDYAKWVTSGSSMKITDSVTGKEYYYFSWMLVINLTFGEIDNFYFRDEIRQNNPHVFVTGSTLNCGNGTTITLSDNDYAGLSKMTVTEYIGADNAANEDEKKQIYLEHYNSGYWTHPSNIYSYPFQNEISYPGYSLASESDGVPGIFVSDFELGEKGFSASLGRVTRPMYIQYYTIATQEFTEGDLITNSATANTIGNIFYPMERIIQSERIHGFQENHGGSASGINGSLFFSFQKINTEGEPLAGAWFGLFTDSACPDAPLRKAMSSEHGTVTFDNIAAGEYYLKETSAPAGYRLSDTVYRVVLNNTGWNIYDGETELVEITNEPESTFPQPTVISISVNKEWNDAGNQDGIRPDDVTVQLFADGTEQSESVTLNTENDWSYTWEALPEYKDGDKINYTVTETPVPGYTASYRNDGTVFTITNSHTPGEVSKTVYKVWDDADNQDGIRPDSVAVQLYADGIVQGGSVMLNAGNNWRYTWTELPAKIGGKTINYTVREITKISGYDTSYSDDTFTIINSRTIAPTIPLLPETPAVTAPEETTTPPSIPEPTAPSTSGGSQSTTDPAEVKTLPATESSAIVEMPVELPSNNTAPPVPDSTIPATADEPIVSSTMTPTDIHDDNQSVQTDDKNNSDDESVPREDTTTSDEDFAHDDIPDTAIRFDETTSETTVILEISDIPSPQTGDIGFPIVLSAMSLSAFAFLVMAKKRLWIRL